MNQHETKSPGLLFHGGEMGKLITEFDWSNTSLGLSENWPSYIKTSVRLCLDSLFPLALWIGPEFRFIYNDACRPALGKSKHPIALGQPGEKIWPEIWDTIGPMLEHVMKTGESTWEKDQLLLIDRHGYLEETYWTYSYSPIRNDLGKIVGIFSVVKETTVEMINDRHVNELKVSAEKYKESSSRLLLAIASTQMGTWDYNPVTDELELSVRTREIFNFPDDGKIDMMDLYDTIIENDRAHVISSIQYALMLISDGNLDLEFSIKGKGLSKEKILKLNGKTFFDDKGNAYRFVGTVLDITEQKRFSEELESRIELRTQELKMANEELMKINSKLEKSNKELESFTYIASHDLQEPLRKILFFSDIIQKNNNIPNSTGTYFKKISDSAKRMSDLISGLHQYSTISHSNDPFINVDLNTILQHTREDYEILIIEKGASILTDPLPVVRGNRVQLGQLITNLISNALKFSDKPPVINIEYRLKKATELELEFHSPHTVFHEITIRDNGIGFEKQYCDQIFVIFQRLHNRTDFPGMGLGLALCKKIIENHQGSIHVKSIPGEGSSFTIYLPV